MAYAKTTKVPVAKTAMEIQMMLKKAGAIGFIQASQANMAYIGFGFGNTAVKMKLKLPPEPSANANQKSIATYEQLCRQKWRGLLLCIKAKIEAVESGIETFEQAFLPHIVLTDGSVVGDKLIPNLGKMDGSQTNRLLGFEQ